jgi:UDP-2,3-diacylglucosamine pyrophosphatase LpxH
VEQTFRAIWLSDVHLGSRACRINLFLDFLRRTRCETLYLVGDIVDLESLRSSFYWPESHTEALRLLWRKSQEGTRVVYIPGNHDDDLRSLVGAKLGNVTIARQWVHTTEGGRRLLVLHGDEFDALIRAPSVAAWLGAGAYRTLLLLNRFVHWVHDVRGRPYWSLAQHVKGRFAKAQKYMRTFRKACLRAAAERGVDGVVCGHIHGAELTDHDGLMYCNDGDWVESCTALVEHAHGALELLVWRPETAALPVALPVRDAA